MHPAIDRALARAADDLAAEQSAAPDGRPRRRRRVLGDPQAPFEKLLAILHHQRLLGEDGRLHPDVFLVSIGDHFDYGGPSLRGAARRSGALALAWLAAHPADQVALILGNHDTARVGELAELDASSFAEAQAEADAAYRDGEVDPRAEAALLARHPGLPTAECVARDFSAFAVEQRALVTRLLRAQRFQLALAHGSASLLLHAGVTAADLLSVGLDPQAPAPLLAEGLNALLARAVAQWTGGRLPLGPLHRHGDAAGGEGRGILYHRPGHPRHSQAQLFAGPPRRRFDPRELPLGLTQVVGHIRDAKCRSLLGPWASAEPAEDGPLRHLFTDGAEVRYARGTPPRPEGMAAMVFTDAGMSHAAVERYELYDLDEAGTGSG